MTDLDNRRYNIIKSLLKKEVDVIFMLDKELDLIKYADINLKYVSGNGFESYLISEDANDLRLSNAIRMENYGMTTPLLHLSTYTVEDGFRMYTIESCNKRCVLITSDKFMYLESIMSDFNRRYSLIMYYIEGMCESPGRVKDYMIKRIDGMSDSRVAEFMYPNMVRYDIVCEARCICNRYIHNCLLDEDETTLINWFMNDQFEAVDDPVSSTTYNVMLKIFKEII